MTASGPALLIVCATAAERDAAARELTVDVMDGLLRADTGAGRVELLVSGVGIAAAAAATGVALAHGRYGHVLNVGVAGGFAPIELGSTVVATAVVEADLGAEDDATFLPISALGLGDERRDLDPVLAAVLARRAGATSGAVLSVSTVTGSAATASARRRRCPDAVAEAMEGAGVLAAAVRCGVAFGEVRTVSNHIGPRDRAAWRLDLALTALAHAVAAITAAPLDPSRSR